LSTHIPSLASRALHAMSESQVLVQLPHTQAKSLPQSLASLHALSQWVLLSVPRTLRLPQAVALSAKPNARDPSTGTKARLERESTQRSGDTGLVRPGWPNVKVCVGLVLRILMLPSVYD